MAVDHDNAHSPSFDLTMGLHYLWPAQSTSSYRKEMKERKKKKDSLQELPTFCLALRFLSSKPLVEELNEL